MLTLAGAGLAAAPAAAADLKVGDQAPNFKLQASDGKTYQLADFKGKEAVVLAWFPKAFTQGCTIECKSLAEHGDMIEKYKAKYFMVSVDPLEGDKGNIAFAKEHGNNKFPLLSDPSKEIATSYGVLNTERGFANRWTFYIDKTGKISAIDKDVSKRLATSAEDMAAMLKQLGVEEKK
ncbi:MAG: peroxiredoxin family protein [Acidobacteriota bacterium]